MKRFLFFGISLAALAVSCTQKVEQKRVSAPVVVDVLVASEANFVTSVELNGSVLSEEMVELHPEVSGRLTYLDIPDGARVLAGTVLAKINDADLQAQLAQQRVQLELALKTKDRMQKLLAVNGVNQAEYDVALSAVNAIEANVKVLEAQIDKTVIRAPFSGTLGLRLVSLGAFVTPQTLIGTLQQTDRVKIDFMVPEGYVNLVNIGNRVLVETSELAGRQEAIISAIEPQINIESRTMKVRARLSGSSVQLGAFVKVLLTKEVRGIMVPSNAIIPDANSNQVVVVKNGRAEFVNVETGIRNADEIQLQTGVSEGDSVVISGVLFVRAKALVKVRKVVTPAIKSNSKPQV